MICNVVWCDHYTGEDCGIPWCPAHLISNTMDDTKNDLVAVVRCKDCKHRNRLAYCPLCGVMVTPDDYFCADGERKETDE